MLRTLAVALVAATGAHHATHHRRCVPCDRGWARVHLRHHHPRAEWTAVASYFGGGPGACGGGSWGVASKTLPCGTRLRICAATCAEVSVTDRGPYIEGRELDLTEEVAQAIAFPMSAGVAAVRVSAG